MKLYFDNGENKLRLLGEYDSEDLCFKEINKFLEERKYKSYYTRSWNNNDENIKFVDVGSHTEFFQIHSY